MTTPLFLLDENVILWAMALSRIDYQGGRYVRIGESYLDAYDLLSQIVAKGHSIVLSPELSDRYVRHRAILTRSGLTFAVDPMERIGRLQSVGRVRFEIAPAVVSLPDDFPEDDRYLAYLALATGATLVTEDDGIHVAAAGGALAFEVLRIAEALERARA